MEFLLAEAGESVAHLIRLPYNQLHTRFIPPGYEFYNALNIN